jgi:hypothetical protein
MMHPQQSLLRAAHRFPVCPLILRLRASRELTAGRLAKLLLRFFSEAAQPRRLLETNYAESKT